MVVKHSLTRCRLTTQTPLGIFVATASDQWSARKRMCACAYEERERERIRKGREAKNRNIITHTHVLRPTTHAVLGTYTCIGWLQELHDQERKRLEGALWEVMRERERARSLRKERERRYRITDTQAHSHKHTGTNTQTHRHTSSTQAHSHKHTGSTHSHKHTGSTHSHKHAGTGTLTQAHSHKHTGTHIRIKNGSESVTCSAETSPHSLVASAMNCRCGVGVSTSV